MFPFSCSEFDQFKSFREYLVPLRVTSSANPLSVITYIQTSGDTEKAP